MNHQLGYAGRLDPPGENGMTGAVLLGLVGYLRQDSLLAPYQFVCLQ